MISEWFVNYCCWFVNVDVGQTPSEHSHGLCKTVVVAWCGTQMNMYSMRFWPRPPSLGVSQHFTTAISARSGPCFGKNGFVGYLFIDMSLDTNRPKNMVLEGYAGLKTNPPVRVPFSENKPSLATPTQQNRTQKAQNDPKGSLACPLFSWCTPGRDGLRLSRGWTSPEVDIARSGHRWDFDGMTAMRFVSYVCVHVPWGWQ